MARTTISRSIFTCLVLAAASWTGPVFGVSRRQTPVPAPPVAGLDAGRDSISRIEVATAQAAIQVQIALVLEERFRGAPVTDSQVREAIAAFEEALVSELDQMAGSEATALDLLRAFSIEPDQMNFALADARTYGSDRFGMAVMTRLESSAKWGDFLRLSQAVLVKLGWTPPGRCARHVTARRRSVAN